MGLFDFIFGKTKKDLESLDQINDELIKNNPGTADDEQAYLKRASKLLTSQHFKEAIQAYSEMCEKFPANKGVYQSQIGAAWYFLGNFEKAIDFYKQAKENGADASMMDDNIQEALDALKK